jgi:hypothetical protein
MRSLVFWRRPIMSVPAIAEAIRLVLIGASCFSDDETSETAAQTESMENVTAEGGGTLMAFDIKAILTVPAQRRFGLPCVHQRKRRVGLHR